jgi:hypothetical protein
MQYGSVWFGLLQFEQIQDVVQVFGDGLTESAMEEEVALARLALPKRSWVSDAI